MEFVQILDEILRLQPAWTHENTEEMAQRGNLIRHSAPDWLRLYQQELADAMQTVVDNVLIEGRDATGPKSEIPWFRFANREYSPRATDSWYCVYLFRADGSAVYLSLMCGSTTWNGSMFVPREVDELERLASWGRGAIAERLKGLDVSERISSDPLQLFAKKTKLAAAYERSSAISLKYEAGALPPAKRFLSDAKEFAALLGDVYAFVNRGEEPGSLSPEVLSATLSASEAAGRRGNTGQGFRVSADERRSIEKAAMASAKKWLLSENWHVVDRSASSPYDFECRKYNQRLFVEVKGTTSHGRQIVLTRNEVEFHRRQFPNNALIVVSGIAIDKNGKTTTEHAEVHVTMPWEIESKNLQVISYTYRA